MLSLIGSHMLSLIIHQTKPTVFDYNLLNPLSSDHYKTISDSTDLDLLLHGVTLTIAK